MSLAALLLHAGRPQTLDEVREVMPEYREGEAGRQMFIRDKRELADAGMEVEEADDRYWIERSRVYVDELLLEDTERAALLVALLSVREGRGSLRSVGATFGGFGDLEARVGESVVDADLNAVAPVRLLNRAVVEHRIVTGVYSGKARRLEPYGLILRRGHWYLHALDVGDGQRKNFRIERFTEGPAVVGPAGVFRRPDDVDLDRVLLEGWQLPSDETYTVVLDIGQALAGRAAFEVAERGEVEWLADGSVRVRMEVSHLDAFRSWLLSYREHAVVVSPAKVRSHVVSWLESVVSAVSS